jgi:hypothetical protein
MVAHWQMEYPISMHDISNDLHVPMSVFYVPMGHSLLDEWISSLAIHTLVSQHVKVSKTLVVDGHRDPVRPHTFHEYMSIKCLICSTNLQEV